MAKSVFPESLLNVNELNLEKIASKMLYFTEQVHLIHWQTLSYAEHTATGTFYEFLQDFKDGLMEKLMGYTGRKIGVYKVEQLSSVSCSMIVNDILSFASELKNFAGMNGYMDISAMAETLSGEAAKVKYLLTLS